MDLDLDRSGSTGHGKRTVFLIMMLRHLPIYVGKNEIDLKDADLTGMQKNAI